MKLDKNKKYYSTGELAELLEVTRQSVLRWIKEGKIRAIATPGGTWKIPAQEVRRILEGKIVAR